MTHLTFHVDNVIVLVKSLKLPDYVFWNYCIVILVEKTAQIHQWRVHQVYRTTPCSNALKVRTVTDYIHQIMYERNSPS